MSLYTETYMYLSTLRVVEEWDELQIVLRRAVISQPPHWRLAALSCEAVGGEWAHALPAVAALGCLHLAMVLIDDMVDNAPKGQYIRLGHAATSNLASALQAAGLEAIARSHAAIEVQSAVQNKLNQMLLTIALGQHRDAANARDQESYWQAVRTKSSPFFGAALYAGARMGGSSVRTAAELEEIGEIYGELVQIRDDLNDVMEVPAHREWTQRRSPLPVLFAQVVPHQEQAKFKQLCQQVSDPAALVEAHEILIRCGAINHALDQLLQRHEQAMEFLNGMDLVHMEAIGNLLDETIAPVSKLLE